MMEGADESKGGQDGGDLMYSPTTAIDAAKKKSSSDDKKDPQVPSKEPLMKKLMMESQRKKSNNVSKSRTSRLRQEDTEADDGVEQPFRPGRSGPLYSPASMRDSKQIHESTKRGTVAGKESLAYTPIPTSTIVHKSAAGIVPTPKKSANTFVASSLMMDVLNRNGGSSLDRGATINDTNDVERGVIAVEPSPANQQVQPTPSRNSRTASAPGKRGGPVEEVTATAVDVDEENRKLQERIDREIEEKLARQLADETNGQVEVAEAVTGFWCSQRFKIIGAICAFVAIAAIVTGTVLPRALEPPPPTPSPTPAPTSVLESLTGLLSSVSFDDGLALNTSSTPQNDALNWLADNLLIESYSEDVKITRYSLATLYFSTNGDEWYYNPGWLDETGSVCDWYVATNNGLCTNGVDKNVTELNFCGRQRCGNNLAGTIPVELALLSTLEKVHFGSNVLSGTIPSEIALLANLTFLVMDENYLRGFVPSEIGGMTNLDYLAIEGNRLEGMIPSEIGALSRLTSFFLHRNKLTGMIPTEIALLTDLADNGFSLGDNMLTGRIPSEIGQMTNLESLVLYQNQLSSPIPVELWQATHLKGIYLWENRFDGWIPSEIGRLKKLEKLQLSANNFSGTIPAEIGFASALYVLRLKSNDITGTIPPELTSLPLTYLSVGDNRLTGTIPTEIGLLSRMSHLFLGQNLLVGSIPHQVGSLTRFTSLQMSNNILSGTIPTETGLLRQLRYLSLENNRFTGMVPSEILQLKDLAYFSIYNNSLAGDFTCNDTVRECYVSCFDQKCEWDEDSCPAPQDKDSPCRSL